MSREAAIAERSPHNPLIPSTAEAMSKRCEEAVALMQRAFDVALAVFGDEESRRRWSDVPPKKLHGRAKGSTKPQEDWTLLVLHDALVSTGKNKRRLPGEMGKTLAGKSWPALGITRMTTPGALTKRLGRLLKRREEDRRARAIGNPLNWRDK
jgi:hypothetical protein